MRNYGVFVWYDNYMEKYKTVDDYLNGLDSERQLQIEKLRHFILDEAPLLTEHIKWNALSYVKNGEDRITFNTVNKEQVVKLVFHMGATKKEDKNGLPILKDAALIEWASDIRGYMTFKNLQEIISNEKEIRQIVREWLALD